ncbi:MAG: Vgb family protein [Vulcanimicrobiaceae bacterium]
MRTLAIFAFLSVCLVSCSSGGSSGSPIPVVTPVPTPQAGTPVTAGISAGGALYQAVLGPDSRLWFSEFSKDRVAAMTSAGVVTEYATAVAVQPNGIAVGSDGNIWTGGYGGVITAFSVSGAVVGSYPVAGAHFGALIAGPNNLIWFTDYGNNKVGTITTAGAVTEFPALAGGVSELAVGPDGNVWVTESANGAGVAKISPTGALLATYSSGIPSNLSSNGIISGPDGNLYVTLDGFSGTVNDAIAKITTSGTITMIGSLAPSSYPNELAVGKDGNIYFSEYNAQHLGKITVATSAVSESTFTPVAGDSGFAALATGSDGRLYLGSHNAIYPFSL